MVKDGTLTGLKTTTIENNEASPGRCVNKRRGRDRDRGRRIRIVRKSMINTVLVRERNTAAVDDSAIGLNITS